MTGSHAAQRHYRKERTCPNSNVDGVERVESNISLPSLMHTDTTKTGNGTLEGLVAANHDLQRSDLRHHLEESSRSYDAKYPEVMLGLERAMG